VEGVSIDEVKRQFDVNFFGVVRVTQAVLPVMRKAKSGTIVITSSVIGGMSSPFGATYAASKWAVEGWAESASYELLPFGIQVKLVQPGGYKTSIQETGMSMGLEVKSEGGEVYAPMAEGIKAMMAGVVWHDPTTVVAEAFYQAATEQNPLKMRYPVYHEEDGYGKVYALRKEKGAEAQYAATLASMQPKE
jgi:NAD(P)-dependent dehydrogenase (short-subunit alcohol dehydrogenase family)